MRANTNAKITYGQVREKTKVLPESSFTYGRPNRPQTPVTGIIKYDYANESEVQMMNRYSQLKSVKGQKTGPQEIRFTAA